MLYVSVHPYVSSSLARGTLESWWGGFERTVAPCSPSEVGINDGSVVSSCSFKSSDLEQILAFLLASLGAGDGPGDNPGLAAEGSGDELGEKVKEEDAENDEESESDPEPGAGGSVDGPPCVVEGGDADVARVGDGVQQETSHGGGDQEAGRVG